MSYLGIYEIIQALGLSGDASFRDILKAIEELKYRITVLEDNERMSHFSKDWTTAIGEDLDRLGKLQGLRKRHIGESDAAYRQMFHFFSTTLTEIRASLGLPAVEVTMEAIQEILDKIEALKRNQRRPGHSLGKYRNECPHGRPLSDICPQCYAYPGGKFRE